MNLRPQSPLSDLEIQVLAFAIESMNTKSRLPVPSELCSKFGWTSRAQAGEFLQRLIAKRALVEVEGKWTTAS